MTKNRDIKYLRHKGVCIPGIPVVDEGMIVAWLCMDCGKVCHQKDVTSRLGTIVSGEHESKASE